MEDKKTAFLTHLKKQNPNSIFGLSKSDGKYITVTDMINEVENDTELGKQFVEAYAECMMERNT